jgi:2'-5' RNA ligase
VRAFVAVFPPPEVGRALVEAAHELGVVGEVRWTRPEKAHLTLKFLGDVAEEKLGLVAKTLGPLCLRHGLFEARPSRFGAFPSTRRARIVWAGIGEGSEPLRALAEDVEASLEPLGFEREGRAYAPHLTLGRARGRPVSFDVVETPPPVRGFIVRSVELVESVPGGSTYSTLATYPLSERRD